MRLPDGGFRMVRRTQGRPFYHMRNAGGPRGLDSVHLEDAHVFGVRRQKEHPMGSAEEALEQIGVPEIPFYPIDATQMLGPAGVPSQGPHGHAFFGEQSDEFAADVAGCARHDDHVRPERPQGALRSFPWNSAILRRGSPAAEKSSLNADVRLLKTSPPPSPSPAFLRLEPGPVLNWSEGSYPGRKSRGAVSHSITGRQLLSCTPGLLQRSF